MAATYPERGGRRRVRALAALPALTLVGAMAAVLAGCASDIPRAIREAPADPVSVEQVRADPARYPNRRVRWGGTIIAVNNLPEATEVEVLDRPLGWGGEPRTGREGRGRFIARVAGFLDPAEYQKDRALTVAGTLSGVETRPVGEYRYAYPVVAVETRWLWPQSPPPGVYDYPYGYPGWGGPWGPWGPWGGWGGWGGWGWDGPGRPPPRHFPGHGPGFGPGHGHGPGPGGPGPRPGLWR